VLLYLDDRYPTAISRTTPLLLLPSLIPAFTSILLHLLPSSIHFSYPIRDSSIPYFPSTACIGPTDKHVAAERRSAPLWSSRVMLHRANFYKFRLHWRKRERQAGTLNRYSRKRRVVGVYLLLHIILFPLTLAIPNSYHGKICSDLR